MMANEDYISLLREDVHKWNEWRANLPHKDFIAGVDFRKADISNTNLTGAIFSFVDLSDANLQETKLDLVNFGYAKLNGANLKRASLISVNFNFAQLNQVNLSHADLCRATFLRTELAGADLTEAALLETIFADVNLSDVVGLHSCRHSAASTIDHRTLGRSGPLPLSFLRGVGLPETLIDYLPSLLNQPIQHYSCFISYSTKDQYFADRIHADLQNKGARCWFAPHDMKIGGKILDEIDAAIRLRDKVLLILSEHSIKSDWVEDEVMKAFEEERRRGQSVLFPIRLDDAVMETNEAWAAKLRTQRNIGDFRKWKDYDVYNKAFDRVLRDLTVKNNTEA